MGLEKTEAGPNPLPLAAQQPPFGPGSFAHSMSPCVCPVFCPIALLYQGLWAQFHKRELPIPQQPWHKASTLPKTAYPPESLAGSPCGRAATALASSAARLWRRREQGKLNSASLVTYRELYCANISFCIVCLCPPSQRKHFQGTREKLQQCLPAPVRRASCSPWEDSKPRENYHLPLNFCQDLGCRLREESG